MGFDVQFTEKKGQWQEERAKGTRECDSKIKEEMVGKRREHLFGWFGEGNHREKGMANVEEFMVE